MSKKRQSDINPDNINELFLKPGDDIPYRLILCNTEPIAQFQRVDRTTPDDPVGISGLSGFVLLKPVRPLIKAPAPHKVRSDKGTTRVKKPEQVSSPVTIEPAKWPESGASLSERLYLKRICLPPAGGLPDVSTFSVSTGKEGEKHILTLGGRGVPATTLRDGVMELFAYFGIDRKYIDNSVDSEGKEQLLNILNSGQ